MRHVDALLLQRPHERLEVLRPCSVVTAKRREARELTVRRLDEAGGADAGAVEEGGMLELTGRLDTDVKVVRDCEGTGIVSVSEGSGEVKR